MKLYHVETQEDYDALMVNLEEEGYRWNDKEKPTEYSSWNIFKKDTVMIIKYDIYLGEASKEYCERVYPDTPIKKYKAKQDKVAKYHDDAKNRKILTDDMGAYPVPLTPYSNEPIYIFNVGLVEQVKFPNRTDELLERIAEDVYDEIGDYAEDYLDDVDEKHQTELQELIRDWAERHDYLPNYFTISLTELIDTRNLEEV